MNMEFPVERETARGYLALPAGGKGPGVLALHAWWGPNDFFRSFCDRLAQAGFVVLAPDLYHGQIATTIDDAERLSSALDAKQANRELVAALTTLKTHPASSGEHTGVVGFSLGAYFALWLADEKPADVAAVVLFYGTGAEVTRAKAAFLGHFAEQDSFEPPESVNSLEDQLRAAGRDVTFYTYPGTGHWFFEADVPAAYNAEAAALAWERTVSFLRRSLI